MPELPEVESVRRQLEPILVGRTIRRVEVVPQARFSRVCEAQGATVTNLRRRGKYLLAGLQGAPAQADVPGVPEYAAPEPASSELAAPEPAVPDRELVMHLGMTGSFRVRGRDGWTADPYVRATLHLDTDILDFRDVRRFGTLAVVRGGDYSGIATLAALGPEPLSDAFTPEGFARALARTQMAVKPYLLTQRPVAGVGNIYADEALWVARINPQSRRVGPARARALWQAIRTVLAGAIEREGTTFRDYQMVNGQSGRNASFLNAYGQAGQPCARCRTTLRRIELGGRGTTYCPRCQRR